MVPPSVVYKWDDPASSLQKPGKNTAESIAGDNPAAGRGQTDHSEHSGTSGEVREWETGLFLGRKQVPPSRGASEWDTFHRYMVALVHWHMDRRGCP